jgi:hypothetical protein
LLRARLRNAKRAPVATRRNLSGHSERGIATMINQTPSDEGISAMVDIVRTSGQNLNPEQRLPLDRLVADGLIENTAAAKRGEAAKYAVTPKGQKMLDDRGVGANES